MNEDRHINVDDQSETESEQPEEAAGSRAFLLGDIGRSAIVDQLTKGMQDAIESPGISEVRRQLFAAGTSLVEAVRGTLPFSTPLVDLAQQYKTMLPATFPGRMLAAAGLDESVIPGLAGATTWREQFGTIDSGIFKTVVPDAPNLRSITDELIERATFDGLQSAALSDLAIGQKTLLERFAPTRDLQILVYPPNLSEIQDLTLEVVEEVAMVDGIALYGVPRQSVAEALVGAESPQQRREILGRRWKQISADCREVIAGLDDRLKDYRRAVTVALDALDAGHVDAAQALAASALDAFLETTLKKNDRVSFKPSKNGHRTTVAYDNLGIRKFIAFAPIWQAYQRYERPDDPVPSTFSRHATAHSVAPQQFNRRNTVQALMLVSGLLYYLNEKVVAAAR